MDKELLKQQVCAAIDASAAQIKAIADCIADEPELGFKERPLLRLQNLCASWAWRPKRALPSTV